MKRYNSTRPLNYGLDGLMEELERRSPPSPKPSPLSASAAFQALSEPGSALIVLARGRRSPRQYWVERADGHRLECLSNAERLIWAGSSQLSFVGRTGKELRYVKIV